MEFDLTGKVIMVTGASGGLGSEIAKIYAEHGATVYAIGRAVERLQYVNDLVAAGYKAKMLPFDVNDEEAWPKAIEQVMSESGRIDVLMNNAGINIRKPIEEMVKDEWMSMMETNTASVFLGIKSVLPIMRAQGGGAIINMSSMCGLIGHKFTPEAYTATKGAVTLLTRSIASRYGCDNIRCNSIHPCTIDTPLVAKVMNNPVTRQQRIDEVPLGHIGSVMDVAYAALYLASNEAAFLNGVNLPVDGGVTCY